MQNSVYRYACTFQLPCIWHMHLPLSLGGGASGSFPWPAGRGAGATLLVPPSDAAARMPAATLRKPPAALARLDALARSPPVCCCRRAQYSWRSGERCQRAKRSNTLLHCCSDFMSRANSRVCSATFLASITTLDA